MQTAEAINALYRERLAYYADLHSGMRKIRSIYKGETTVDLPDMNRQEQASVPNLLGQGVDQMGARIASVQPIPYFTPLDPTVKKEIRRAQTAGRVISGWRTLDKANSKMRFRARHLIAYGLSPVVLRWDHKAHRPTWQVRSPLETFPSVDLLPGTVTPTDVVFCYQRSVGWLRAAGYEQQVNSVLAMHNAPRDSMMTLLEYCSDEENSLVLIGGAADEATMDGLPPEHRFNAGPNRSILLEQTPNVIGINQAVVPARVALDDPTGQFNTMTGMYYAQAKLMALEVLAVEKGIFPDTYLESRPNELAKIVDGPHDGRTGLITVVQGGTVREVQTQPGYMTTQTIDRLERNQRVTSGTPSEFGGEGATGIRTGRRGDAVMSATIDFPIAEAQEVFAQSMEEENKAAIALAKHRDGSATRTIYVGIGNNAKAVTYVADDVFTSDQHTVDFPIAGTDMNGTLVALGQRVGMGTMSKETASQLDPYISNPEFEHDQIIAEGLEQALVAGIQQQASSGAIPPLVLGKIMKLVRADRMELADAITKVTEDAAQEAAAQAQAQAPGGPPAAPGADAAAAGPAQQALAGGMSPIPGESQGQTDLASMLGSLRRPVMAVRPTAGTVDARSGKAMV